MDWIQENTFRYGLLMQPRLETKFWDSEAYKEWCWKLDSWCILFRLLNNSITFVLQYTLPAGTVKTWSRVVTVGWALLAVAEYMWMCQDPNYHRWRTLVLVINRAGRFALMFIVLSGLHKQSEALTMRQHWQELSSPFLSSRLVALRSLVLSSLAVPCMMHAYAAPLPFTYQLGTHLLYFVVLVVCHLPGAVAVVGGPEPTGIYTDVCEVMNMLAMAAEAVVSGATANMNDVLQVCHDKPAPALLLFLMAFMGTVLPVYFAYRLERHAKELFLFSLMQQSPTGPFEAIGSEPHAPGIANGTTEVLLSEVAGFHSSSSYAETDGLDELYPPALELTLVDVVVLSAAALLCWVLVIHWVDELLWVGVLARQWFSVYVG